MTKASIPSKLTLNLPTKDSLMSNQTLAKEIVAALSDLSVQQINNGGLNTYPQPVIDAASALCTAYQQVMTTAAPAVFPVDSIPTEDPQAGPPPASIVSADSHIYNAYKYAQDAGYPQVVGQLLHAHQCCANMGSTSPQWSPATFGGDLSDYASSALESVKAAPTNPFAYIGLGLGLLSGFGLVGALVGAAVGAIGSPYLKKS